MMNLVAAAALISFFASDHSSEVIGGPSAPPVEGGGPVEVGIGFHIVDFARFTAREESFDITAHLELRWLDPRLANRAADSNSKIWTPRLNYDNAVEPPKPHGETVLEVDSEGWVTSRSIISGKFSTPLNLRKFPFDMQDVVVRISLFNDQSKVSFAAIPASMRMHDDVFVTDWSLQDQSFHVKPRRYRPGGAEYSLMEYRLRVARRSTFYAWRVFLPLTILSMIPALVFWFEPTNLQPQISTCMGTLVAMLTFGYSVDFALPKVNYLTLVDRHAMIGFLFAASATVSVTLIHQFASSQRVPKALKIQGVIRRLYPLIYLAVAALNFSLLMDS